MNKLFILLVGLAVGAALMFVGLPMLSSESATAQSEEQPLYWVAPMDANYRRDKPGLSPMGMDLVPVYADAQNGQDASPGTITVSPDVVNNIGVRTGLVMRQPLESQIATVGYVRYDEHNLVHIHPRVAGWIEKLHVKAAGDPVKKGAPLYALYSPELVDAQEGLILAVKRNNSRLIQAAENRLKALKIPRSFIRRLKRTQKIRQTLNFYTPQSGVVDQLNIREGFYVQPGTTLLSIGALDRVWVEAEVFERQASLVKLNDPVTMSLDYLPGRTWNSKVDYIYPTLDSHTRTLRLRIRFENNQHELKPNMFAHIRVHTQNADRVLVIPREALIRTGSQDRVVLALGDGRFKSIAVTVGRLDPTHAEIIDGLDEGESVVTSAQFLLDSESSKTSDFKRMQQGIDPSSAHQASVTGVVNTIDLERKLINISRGPIPQWNRPAATLDFTVQRNRDLTGITVGAQVELTFAVVDGKFMILAIAPLLPTKKEE